MFYQIRLVWKVIGNVFSQFHNESYLNKSNVIFLDLLDVRTPHAYSFFFSIFMNAYNRICHKLNSHLIINSCILDSEGHKLLHNKDQFFILKTVTSQIFNKIFYFK